MCCRQLLPGGQSERDYSSFQHWEGDFYGWELLKLTLIPLRVAVINTVCFTAVFPGRRCGLLDSWACSLIAVGEGGVRAEEEREKKRGKGDSMSPLQTCLLISQPWYHSRWVWHGWSPLALPANSCCPAWPVPRCKMCSSINAPKKLHEGWGGL